MTALGYTTTAASKGGSGLTREPGGQAVTGVQKARAACRLLWLVAISATGALAYWRYSLLENVAPAGP